MEYAIIGTLCAMITLLIFKIYWQARLIKTQEKAIKRLTHLLLASSGVGLLSRIIDKHKKPEEQD